MDTSWLPERSPDPLWHLVQSERIKTFNDANERKHVKFECWPVMFQGDEGQHCNWVVIVIKNPQEAHPDVSIHCHIRLDEDEWWHAKKMTNLWPTINLRGKEHDRYATYQVQVPLKWMNKNQSMFKPVQTMNAAASESGRPMLGEPANLWANLRLSMKSTSELSRLAKAKRVPDAAWKFEDARKYYDIFQYGTRKEFEFEQDEVLKFNSNSIYRSWLISSHFSDDQHQDFVVLIKSPEKPECFPKVGDPCKLIFAREQPRYSSEKADKGQEFDEHSLKKQKARFQKAFRIENPTKLFELGWGDFSTFRISVDTAHEDDPLSSTLKDFTSLVDLKDIERQQTRGCSPSITPRDDTSFWAHVCADLSDTTMNVELAALEAAASADPHGRVAQAFSYLRDFKDPVSHFNLFEALPHMRDPDDTKGELPDSFKALYRDLDEDQKAVYANLLSKLPARVGIIPGGSGTGKTQLMMAISALALARDRRSDAFGAKSGGPVLFVMEANRLVNDAATRIWQLFKQLGRDDLVIVRGYNLNYENAYGTQGFLKADDDDQSPGSVFERLFPAQRADHIPQLRERRKVKGECLAPTIRDFLRWFLRSRASEFPTLTKWVNGEEDRRENSNFDSVIKREWDRLLRRALPHIDIMVTTVNGAAKVAPAAGNAFQPKLVIFDEAARARELSTLVLISCFPSAEAWLFTGTCELSRPYVGSYGKKKLWNPCKEQLRTPMMERAQQVIPNMQWLSLNHRTYGNLQDLPSNLFWDGKIKSAIPECDRFPAATRHLLQYLQRFATGQELTVPRLLVHTEQIIKINPNAISKYNENHVKWVVHRLIRDLAQDTDFRSAEGEGPGSITVVTPYRAQLTDYNQEIKDLLDDLDKSYRGTGKHGRTLHRDMRIEARSTDTVQSHSSDVLVFDLTHFLVTPHLDDVNRLCVSLTRARQAEIIIMHRGMLESDRWGGSLVESLYHHCDRHGQVVNVNMRDDSPVENIYTVHKVDSSQPRTQSAVPRQLPDLPPSLDGPQDQEQSEASHRFPASESQPLEATHNGDGENMFQSSEAFGFEMVRKAMELGLSLSSDIPKGE